MENSSGHGSGEKKVPRKPLSSISPMSPTIDRPQVLRDHELDSDGSQKNESFTKTSGLASEDGSELEPWIDNRSTLRRWVTDWWLLELLSCLLSLAASIAIIGILVKYDKRSLPNWPTYITLNSLLALFTTIAKAGLMLPIAEALGQLKWIWFFQAQRPLTHFQTFDEASRGMTGSFKLLGILRGRHLACLGAVISILGLGTSFITQQMIAFPTRNVYTVSNFSTAPASNLFDAVRFRGAITVYADLPIKGAIQQGIYQPVNDSLSVISPTCSSGNCTWDSFSSLEVCSEVADVTNKLYLNETTGTQLFFNTTSGENYTIKNDPNIFLPNGAWLSGVHANLLNMTTLYPQGYNQITPFSNITLAFGDKRDVVISDSFLVFNPDLSAAGKSKPVTIDNYAAYEMILYFCVKTHTAHMINGKATENTSSISTYVRPTASLEVDTQLRPATFNMSQDADSRDDFTIWSSASTALGDAIGLNLVGQVVNGFFDTEVADIFNSDFWDIWNSPENGTLEENLKVQKQFVANLTSNIATSLSNNIRGRTDKGIPAIGISQTSESYVKVRWAWLSYLLTLFVLSFGFLVATIIKSSRSEVNILKSSALAMMCGMNEESRGNMKQIEMRGRLWQRAQSVNVRLVKKDRGWGLERNG